MMMTITSSDTPKTTDYKHSNISTTMLQGLAFSCKQTAYFNSLSLYNTLHYNYIYREMFTTITVCYNTNRFHSSFTAPTKFHEIPKKCQRLLIVCHDHPQDHDLGDVITVQCFPLATMVQAAFRVPQVGWATLKLREPLIQENSYTLSQARNGDLGINLRNVNQHGK